MYLKEVYKIFSFVLETLCTLQRHRLDLILVFFTHEKINLEAEVSSPHSLQS